MSPNALNQRTGLAVLALVGGMLSLSFAAVPLYDLFCRVTGFGGTTQVAEGLPDQVLERTITIRFDAQTRHLPWEFGPESRSVTIPIGSGGLINYVARNTGAVETAGTASYNVTPPKAGIYFNKIQCFCFTEQRLKPGEQVSMPVSFYVDPAIVEDEDLQGLTTITLSYTFFPDEAGARADFDSTISANPGG